MTLGFTVLVIIDNLTEPMWKWPPEVQEARETTDPYLLRGWRADPTSPDLAFLAAAPDACLMGSEIPDVSRLRDIAPIQDQRGPYGAAFLWVDGTVSAACMLLRDADGTFRVRFTRGLHPAPSGLTSGQFDMVQAGPPIVATGAADVGAATVEVTSRRFGLTIHATVRDGRFVAWWPQPDSFVTYRELDAAGVPLPTVVPIEVIASDQTD
ncbi:MAG: hypothetical protein LH650_02260 [Chloroflexi bacterium]|nr:hypothetical protein [Chloroflexota bacterium]